MLEFAKACPTFLVHSRSTAGSIFFTDQARRPGKNPLLDFSSPTFKWPPRGGFAAPIRRRGRLSIAATLGSIRRLMSRPKAPTTSSARWRWGTVAFVGTFAGRQPPRVARSRDRIRGGGGGGRRTTAPVKSAVTLQISGGICMDLQFKSLWHLGIF